MAVVQHISANLPTIDATLGAGLLGMCLGLSFYGVMLGQTYHYFQTYSKDALIVKAMVVAIMVTETVHTALCVHFAYFYVITNHNNPEAYSTATVSLALLPLTVFLIVLISESFYIRRVYLILRSPLKEFFLVIAGTLILCSAAFAIALTVQLFLQGTFINWLRYTWLVSAAFAPPAVGDLLVAIVLVVTLHGSRTGIKRTDALLNVLKIYGFSTGFFTSLLSTACLVVDLVEAKNLFIIPFSLTAANAYSFSMLATLTMRRQLTQQFDNCDGASEWLGLSALQGSITPRDPKRASGDPEC
ncbi:hypothetical protein C8Q80DRAFT_406309 [Daedaleopsis nitida]|nr:hypothetical protein C8Q80DRAFT_406309 [Daedaleopsis nitida]